MSGGGNNAPRRKATRTPSAGLLTAFNRCQQSPDPPGLENVTGNNAKVLRVVAKVVDALCDGRPGTRFYLGSVSLSIVLGTHQRTAHRWIGQLEARGVMRRVWTGRPVRKDATGKPVPGGRLADRATEFVYMGLPRGSGG